MASTATERERFVDYVMAGVSNELITRLELRQDGIVLENRDTGDSVFHFSMKFYSQLQHLVVDNLCQAMANNRRILYVTMDTSLLETTIQVDYLVQFIENNDNLRLFFLLGHNGPVKSRLLCAAKSKPRILSRSDQGQLAAVLLEKDRDADNDLVRMVRAVADNSADSPTTVRLQHLQHDIMATFEDATTQMLRRITKSQLEAICLALPNNRMIQNFTVDVALLFSKELIENTMNFIRQDDAMTSITILGAGPGAGPYKNQTRDILLRVAAGNRSIFLSDDDLTACACMVLENGGSVHDARLANRTLTLLRNGTSPNPSGQVLIYFELEEFDPSGQLVLPTLAAYLASPQFGTSKYELLLELEDHNHDEDEVISFTYRGNKSMKNKGDDHQIIIGVNSATLQVLLGGTRASNHNPNPNDNMASLLEIALKPRTARSACVCVDFHRHNITERTWDFFCSFLGSPNCLLENIKGLYTNPYYHTNVLDSITDIPLFESLSKNCSVVNIEWEFGAHRADAVKFMAKLQYYTAYNRIMADNAIWTGDGANREWVTALLKSHGEAARICNSDSFILSGLPTSEWAKAVELSLIYQLVSKKLSGLENVLWFAPSVEPVNHGGSTTRDSFIASLSPLSSDKPGQRPDRKRKR